MSRQFLEFKNQFSELVKDNTDFQTEWSKYNYEIEYVNFPTGPTIKLQEGLIEKLSPELQLRVNELKFKFKNQLF